MSLVNSLALDLPKPKPIRPPVCMRENSTKSPTSSSSGSMYTSSEPSRLGWLTAVLVLTPLVVSASNNGTAYPVGYLAITLVELAVSLLAFFNSSRTCCSLSSICAVLTLSALICDTATEVSIGLKPRVSSLKKINNQPSSSTAAITVSVRITFFRFIKRRPRGPRPSDVLCLECFRLPLPQRRTTPLGFPSLIGFPFGPPPEVFGGGIPARDRAVLGFDGDHTD